jgi:hypothetical protein
MVYKYKNILYIFILINFVFFIYYCMLPDINPSNDVFYYQAIADSFYNGTGFQDITSVNPKPIVTPQNGVVFLHILLRWIGFHDPASRLLAIKILNYLGFLCLIIIFFKIFQKLKVSPEITILCMGIILLSAHFLKTIIVPINDGFYCILTAVVFYQIMSYDTENTKLRLSIIALLSILLIIFRLNGPLVILSASVAYALLRDFKKSLIYLSIFIISYVFIFLWLNLAHIDFSRMESVVTAINDNMYFFNQIFMTLIYSIPGAFIGISGRPMVFMLPISISIIIFYALYFYRSMKEKDSIKLIIISFIIINIIFINTIIWYSSRYIIMIVPFTLLAVATYFKDCKKLKVLFSIVLVMTLSVSLYRIIYWDSIFFKNEKSLKYIQQQVREPYILISQFPRYTYYIFNKSANNIEDIKNKSRLIVVFGNKEYIKSYLNTIDKKIKNVKVEKINKQLILGHANDEIINIIKIYDDH